MATIQTALYEYRLEVMALNDRLREMLRECRARKKAKGLDPFTQSRRNRVRYGLLDDIDLGALLFGERNQGGSRPATGSGSRLLGFRKFYPGGGGG